MPVISILLSVISLLVLCMGVYTWRLTSSRPLLINVLLCSAFLLIGAYAVTNSQRPEFPYIMPFFAAMLLGGRAIAFLWRSKKEPNLFVPGMLMLGMTIFCVIGAVAAFLR